MSIELRSVETGLLSISSRRGFFGRSAGLLLAAGIGSRLFPSLAAEVASAEESKAAKKVIVGAHPWVYAATQPDRDITRVLPQIFADMAYAGLDGIELMHSALRPDDAVERIAALSKEHRLPVIGMSFSGAMWDRAQHEEILKDAELTIPRLAKLGGKTLGTTSASAKGKKTEEQLDAQAELLRRIMALCESHGVVLNLHNHTWEVADDLHEVRGMIARVPEVKLGPDLNWLVRGGVDPVRFIREFGERIVFVHLRDQNADGTWSEAMGEGDMDYVAIGKALHEIGFSGPAVIELAHERKFTPTRPLRESLKVSREYVRKTMGY
ncbi:MAG: sugar phosphate isomerase/epimerase family protein [Planctomycetota bacterium]